MKHQKIIIRVGLAFAALILIFWAALAIFLPGAIKNAVDQYGKSIGHQISYERLQVSPWILKLDIHGLKVSKESASKQAALPLINIAHLSINAELIHVLIGRIHLSEIKIDQAQISLQRTSNKQGVAQSNFL